MCIMSGLYFRYDTVPSLREGILVGSHIDCLLLCHPSDRNGEEGKQEKWEEEQGRNNNKKYIYFACLIFARNSLGFK